MSLAQCIEAAVSTGRMTTEQADELAEWQADYERALIDTGKHATTASREADKLAVDAMRTNLKREEWVKSLELIALTRLKDNVASHPKGVTTGVMSVLGRDITRQARYENVDIRAQAVRRIAHSMMANMMQALRPSVGEVGMDILGAATDKTVTKNIVRILFNEQSDDVMAQAFAKQWKETAEYLRQQFNKAGGDIKKLDIWHLPQLHSDRAMRRAGKEPWKAFIKDRLDRNKMLNKFNNPMTDGELDRLLDSTFERIASNGLVDLEPGARGGAKMANTRQESRVLHFKNADGWLEYADRFGQSDIYHTMTSYVDSMAHDIAMLEVMGPNPEQAYRVLKDLARKDPVKGVEGNIRSQAMDALWHVVSGKVNHVGSVKMAAFMQATRNTITSAKLGSAALSAIADFAFLRQTAAWADIPMMKVMRREMSLLGDKEQRLVAAKLMIGAEVWATRALAAQRFTEVTGTGVSAQLADMTMRVSGLSALTDAGKTAFGLELAARVVDDFDKTFENLNPTFRKMLEHAKIDAEDWAIMRSTQSYEFNGVKFFDPNALMKRTDLSSADKQRVMHKYVEMQSELSIFAVPEPDARARAITTLGQERGTIPGELVRSVFQFKGFPVAVILSHVYRGWFESTAGLDRLSYLGMLAIYTTAMGYIALEAKEISKGREPRRVFKDGSIDKETLGAAFLQGGGAGILGDFINAGVFGTNRYGQGILTSMAGPVAGLLLSDLPRVTLGQAGKAIEGEDINIPSDIVRTGGRYIPVASSLWYTRLLFERTILDQLQLMTDPKAPRRFKLAEDRRIKEFGQRSWWKKGETLPEVFR